MVQELDGIVNKWGWCKQKHIAELAGNTQMVLPVPAFNGINGGSHADNKLAMQEFMILPIGASSFKEAIKMCSEVHRHLKFHFSACRYLASSNFRISTMYWDEKYGIHSLFP
ncbi:hypothetical protein RND81_09G198400 [Saponaria officinalis]|uniref:phosphopyruvate hydratase n=1 Tax=Saponaria officinalis TaxID=3572 RepID=A0AAW1IN63_SAPOF